MDIQHKEGIPTQKSFNRQERRKFIRRFADRFPALKVQVELEKGKSTAIDLGVCFFCPEHVLAGEGQLTTYLNKMPTHKACRKKANR